MTVRLCGLLHELLNCVDKVPVKKLVCLLPARLKVMEPGYAAPASVIVKACSFTLL
jgi:hypothetical protein